MHYCNLVLIEKTLDIKGAVAKAMGPHEDEGGFWDFYQIGGRYTGALDGYDPETDPANMEPCDLCNGTGDRKDLSPPDWKEKCNGCNGCSGKGRRVKWPTQWSERAGDCIPIEALTEETYQCWRVVTPYGRYYERERYEPWHEALKDRFPKQELPPLNWLKTEYPDHLVVVVDNHS